MKLAQYQLREAALKAGQEILQKWGSNDGGVKIHLYGVPRGGIPAAYLIAAMHPDRFEVIDSPDNAFAIVDDVIDSGITMKRFQEKRHPVFVALFDKRSGPYVGEWLEFPWELSAEADISEHIVRLLEYVGEDPNREGLKETPLRVAKAWKHWCSGYQQKPEEVMKTFSDGAKGVDEMVVVRDIPFYSHCEHHLAPFFGTVTVAYVPSGRILGLSKINRLVGIFAHRLQVQERLTNQIADALVEGLAPLGVGVMVKARHLCIESRGVCQQGSETVTSALRGVIREDAKARGEFLEISK